MLNPIPAVTPSSGPVEPETTAPDRAGCRVGNISAFPRFQRPLDKAHALVQSVDPPLQHVDMLRHNHLYGNDQAARSDDAAFDRHGMEASTTAAGIARIPDRFRNSLPGGHSRMPRSPNSSRLGSEFGTPTDNPGHPDAAPSKSRLRFRDIGRCSTAPCWHSGSGSAHYAASARDSDARLGRPASPWQAPVRQ